MAGTWFIVLSSCSLLQATGPAFQVAKTIRPTDFNTAAPNKPMVLSGMSSTGALAGYYVDHLSLPGHGNRFIVYPYAFVWDGANLYDLNTPMLALASLATCMSPSGVTAGVGWVDANPSTNPAQFGFVWHQGMVQQFASPDGTSIDAVVAVNDLGQVVGTYFGTGQYKRAFFWDGANSVDLGDLGDPDYSFIWPKALNNSGQVVGTVYTFGETGLALGNDAFLWQSEVGMGAIGGVGHTPSYAVGINAAGEIVCAYAKDNPANPMVPLASGFYWADNSLTVLAPLANKKGLVPFAIDDSGQIIGTAYAADGTLHLFTWEAGTALTTDRGSVALSAGDTAFRLTGINAVGNAVGYVNDASGYAQAVWRRLNEPAGTMHNVAAMLPMSAGFVADDSSGTTVLVNDQGRVACTGYDGQGQPVALLLLPDSDGDGMTDEWEADHGLNAYDPNDANADADGDGLTNLQEFQQGSDPNDFYNGQTPTLTYSSGTDQVDKVDAFLHDPLVVQLTKADASPWANAVVTFSVSQGSGGVATAANGATDTSVTVRTDGAGLASVYFKLPGTTCALSEITASAGAAQPVVFRARTEDASGHLVSPTAPSNVSVVLNADGSTDTTWVNNTTSTDPIPIYMKAPNGEWVFIKNMPANSTSVHITEAEMVW